MMKAREAIRLTHLPFRPPPMAKAERALRQARMAKVVATGPAALTVRRACKRPPLDCFPQPGTQPPMEAAEPMELRGKVEEAAVLVSGARRALRPEVAPVVRGGAAARLARAAAVAARRLRCCRGTAPSFWTARRSRPTPGAMRAAVGWRELVAMARTAVLAAVASIRLAQVAAEDAAEMAALAVRAPAVLAVLRTRSSFMASK